ncbi:uncharacterized protein Bfra_000794 [Botrytis fragariae]|uniref:Uncharacterized protein n=1 Tax=Botrytis fragariae TaxID=1964551 RepID=A0A8H6ENE1_9HELO|nr:uncharacterized protein Bfra_000794 [Botrytis fragariae]KAF5878627.1 hypothetical protein Bfra_000794 [Botrytis fragariae]
MGFDSREIATCERLVGTGLYERPRLTRMLIFQNTDAASALYETFPIKAAPKGLLVQITVLPEAH